MGAVAESLRPELFDKEIDDFSIDSRTIGREHLFFALSQPDYERAGFNGTFADGHTFIAQAFARGAVSAVARKDRVTGDKELEALKDRLLLVDDAIQALQTLARKVYEQWARPVVAITEEGRVAAPHLEPTVRHPELDRAGPFVCAGRHRECLGVR